MKKSYKNISQLFLLLSIISCSSKPDVYRINGTIEVKNDTKVYRVIADQNNQPLKVDSSIVFNSRFQMKGESKYPKISFIQVDGYDFNIPFVLEEGDINIKVNKDTISQSKISGTISNIDFYNYQTEIKDYADAISSIRSEIQIAAQNGNNSLIKDLQDDFNNVRDQIFSIELDYINNNFDSYLSSIFLERSISVKTLTIPEAKDLYDKFTNRIKGSDVGLKLKKIFESPNQPLDIGYTVPDFSAPSPDGEIINLNKELGKVTLLEFWASWCAPCRRENPNLVKIYNRHKDQGFNIIGVSLDKNRNQWIQAISDDYLTWKHVSNLKFWQDPIAKLYNITAIPASFIIDQNGKILAKNLRGNQLASKISELVNIE